MSTLALAIISVFIVNTLGSEHTLGSGVGFCTTTVFALLLSHLLKAVILSLSELSKGGEYNCIYIDQWGRAAIAALGDYTTSILEGNFALALLAVTISHLPLALGYPREADWLEVACLVRTASSAFINKSKKGSLEPCKYAEYTRAVASSTLHSGRCFCVPGLLWT